MIDPSTLAELWVQHSDRLLVIARAVGGPAEDAVQESFVALACQNQLPDDPLAWLVRVTRNQLLQWQRAGKRRRNRESARCPPCWFDNSSALVGQSMDAAEVTAALQKLESPQREIIVMHLWGEMTFAAIAEVIDVSRATAHREFCRGLHTLQRQFNPQPASSRLQTSNPSHL